MRRMWLLVFSLAAISVLSLAMPALACPDNQYESCGPFNICVCLPKIGGAVGQGAEHLKNELRGQVVGNPLEAWFNASRNTAVNGAMPIPANIRQALTGFSDQDAMNRVRFRIQDNGALNLAHIIQQWRLYDVTAVTLIDVVIFRGPTEASDVCLWAHELVHVTQFRDWGTHNFAISYARNPNSVEDPAYAVENDCRAKGIAYRAGGFPPQQPMQMGSFCLTPVGRYGPGPSQPIGSPCWINGVQGPIWGQIGY